MALTAQSTLRLATAALDAAGMRAVLDSSGIDPRSCGDLAAVAIAAWRDGWAASGTAAKLAAALRLLDEYGGLDTQPALAGALLHGGPSEAIEVLLAAGADVATESWLHKVPTATVLTMLRVAGAVTAGRGDDGGPLHFACVHGGWLSGRPTPTDGLGRGRQRHDRLPGDAAGLGHRQPRGRAWWVGADSGDAATARR